MREDAVEYAQERQIGSVTFPLRLGSFGGHELMGDRATANQVQLSCASKLGFCARAKKRQRTSFELRKALGVKPVQRAKACVKELISL